jgi:hypothetical protein
MQTVISLAKRNLDNAFIFGVVLKEEYGRIGSFLTTLKMEATISSEISVMN